LCDADGELFIKPCTSAEIDFYESALATHPDFAEWMPLYFGSLALSDKTTDEMIHAAIPELIERAQVPALIKEEVQSHLHLADRPVPELQRAATDGVTWVPNKSRKIKTDRAVVLENTSYGYKRPNIMDAKLGVRLWANDAPLEKRTRFDQIASETTHKQFGFRVAGMRVYKGSSGTEELDGEGYQVYDKYWGRSTVNDDNVLEMIKTFVFNEAAGINQELGKLVAGAFATDLRRIQKMLEAEESRMYSSSLLFVFEGDGEALKAAIEETSVRARASVPARSLASGPCANLRVDSGIGMDDEDNPMIETVGDIDGDAISVGSDESDEFSSYPRIYSVKLIDFAHADWVPGQGPDENILLGVRSLAKLFEDMSQ
jgi:1D-myo-inositol-tetrakisphosphate 5-kinase/inositol-polyphosphate multikinase